MSSNSIDFSCCHRNTKEVLSINTGTAWHSWNYLSWIRIKIIRISVIEQRKLRCWMIDYESLPTWRSRQYSLWMSFVWYSRLPKRLIAPNNIHCCSGGKWNLSYGSLQWWSSVTNFISHKWHRGTIICRVTIIVFKSRVWYFTICR